jgi:proton glutamate symport protein
MEESLANSTPAASVQNKVNKTWWHFSLTQQILIALIFGILLGWLKPNIAIQTGFLKDIFLNLVKSLIAPLIFASVVSGIAGGGDAKKVGRLGLKSLIYFEIATTLALIVGLVVVNTIKPGHGVLLPPASAEVVTQAHPKTLTETIVHIFPSSVIESMASGDVLQIVTFAVIFGLAVLVVGDRAKSIVSLCDSVTQVMFKYTNIIMRFAPLGVGAAIAVTIGKQGVGVILNLGLLLGTLYLALIIFLIILLGAAVVIIKLPFKLFCKSVRDPFTLAFATASSETALPKALESMVAMGVPRNIASFVIPTGYTFNLDGSTLYLAVASVFIAQAAESSGMAHFGLDKQLLLMLTLMITSKGVAAVPRASLVILLAALHSFGLPPEGVVLIFGVDAFMDMARTSVNVVGNCLASIVVAKWEGEFSPPQSS